VSGERDSLGVVPPARSNPSPGPLDFGQNSVLAFLPNGDFLLGDGYQNGRIVRYGPDGRFISEFGSVGSGPGQFDLIHGIAVDRNSRIYVSDRMNHRIQIFTEDGTLIETWNDIWDPVAIMIDENDFVWVLDATLNRILKYDLRGQLLDYFGTYGEASSLGRPGFTCSNDQERERAGVADFHEGACGGFSLPHQMHVDTEGNLYVAQFGGPWIDKYVPKAGADRTRLIGQPLRIGR
jgi:sugar lactone lactonase YvrE